jgi:4-hydroxybenzoate polyprenyltransferase
VPQAAHTQSVSTLSGIYFPFGAKSSTAVFFLLVKESRPIVLLLAGMRFAAGALVAGASLPGPGPVLAGFSWLLVTAGVYLTNASTDIVADTLNGKPRPLAQGLLTKRQVDHAAICSFAGAALIGLYVGPAFLALLGLMGFIGVYYSVGRRPGKSHFLSAAAVVAAGIALPYVAGSLAAHGDLRQSSLTAAILFGCWAAAASISKDFADVTGDQADGRRTLPVVLGPRMAAWIAAGGSVATAIAVPQAAVSSPHLIGLWALPVGALVFAVACIALAVSRDAVSPGTPYRVFMTTQLAANGALITLAPALVSSSI